MLKFLRTQLIIISLFFGQLLTPVAIFGTAAFTSSMTISTPAYAAEEGKKIDTELAMSQIVLVAIALMAPIMGIQCFNTLSTNVFVAASALYIANEIMNYSEYIKKVKAKEGGDDQQITKFDEAAGQANHAADTADKKAQWAQYAAIGFGLATVTALGEWYILNKAENAVTCAHLPLGAACQGKASSDAIKGTMTHSKTIALGMSFIAAPTSLILQCAENKGTNQTIASISSSETELKDGKCLTVAAMVTSLATKELIPKNGLASLEIVTENINAGLHTAIATGAAATSATGVGATLCADTTVTNNLAFAAHTSLAKTIEFTKCLITTNLCAKNITKKTKFYADYINNNKKQETEFLSFFETQKNDPYIVKALSILSELTNPSAKAKTGKGSMAALGVGGLVGIITSMTDVGKTIANFATEPSMRALIFGAFGLMANKTAGDIKSKADEMRSQANTFATLASNLRTKLDTNNIEQKTEDLGLGTTNLKGGDVAFKSPSAYCATGGDKQLTLDKSCKCKKNNTCKMVNLPKKPFMKFPNGNLLSKQASFLQKMMNGTYNGNLAAAKAWGNKASALAIKINKLKGSLLAKMNEGKKKHGLQPVNFDKITSDMAKNLSDQVNKAFNGLSSSQQDSVMAIAPPIIKKNKNKDKKKIAKKSKFNKFKYRKKSGMNGLNFNLAEDDKKDTLEDVVPSKNDQDQYEISVNDINKNESANIFKIISTRYFKSGYDKLFESTK